jgi:hypothetical protein
MDEKPAWLQIESGSAPAKPVDAKRTTRSGGLLLDGRASADDHIQIAILNEPSATHDKRVLTRTDGRSNPCGRGVMLGELMHFLTLSHADLAPDKDASLAFSAFGMKRVGGIGER